MSQLVTVKGTVMEFAWENPHPMITLEVRTDDGKMEKWLVGGPAINRMEANGWTKTTVKPGDVITGIGYQFSDGQKIIRLERVVLADGIVTQRVRAAAMTAAVRDQRADPPTTTENGAPFQLATRPASSSPSCGPPMKKIMLTLVIRPRRRSGVVS